MCVVCVRASVRVRACVRVCVCVCVCEEEGRTSVCTFSRIPTNASRCSSPMTPINSSLSLECNAFESVCNIGTVRTTCQHYTILQGSDQCVVHIPEREDGPSARSWHYNICIWLQGKGGVAEASTSIKVLLPTSQTNPSSNPQQHPPLLPQQVVTEL